MTTVTKHNKIKRSENDFNISLHVQYLHNFCKLFCYCAKKMYSSLIHVTFSGYIFYNLEIPYGNHLLIS